MQRRMKRLGTAVWIAPLAVTLVLVALELLPLAEKSGVPAFRQDWVWPAFRSQCSGVASAPFMPWQRHVLGNPPVYPAAWWPSLLSGTLCQSVGPHASVIVVLAIVLVLAGAAMTLFARTLGCTSAGCTIAAAAYVANPLVLNKLEAGHWYYIAGYALFPVIAALAIREKTRTSWLALGAVVGLAAAQPQFLPMALLVLWLFAIIRRRAIDIVTAALASFVALAITAVQWMPAFVIGSTAFDVLTPLRHWEDSQSVPLSDAFRLLGYIGGYDAQLLAPWVKALWWLLPAGALAGLAASRRSASAWMLAFLAVAGALIASGTLGPLAGAIAWTFAHVRAAALYRELYDVLALTALGTCALTGIAVDRARLRPARFAAYAGAVVLVAACGAVAVRATAGIPTYDPSVGVRSDAHKISAARDQRRFLPLPNAYPLSETGTSSGYTPFILSLGSHPSSATGLRAEFPIAYAIGLIRDGRAVQGRDIFQRAGIGFILNLANLHSRFRASLEPALQALVLPSFDDAPHSSGVEELRGGYRLTVEPFSAAPSSLADRYSDVARDLRTLAGGRQTELWSFNESPDPRVNWARTALWSVLPTWVFAEPPGVFTLRSSAALAAPAGWLVAGASSGAPESPSCTNALQLDRHFELLRCAPNPVLRGTPPLVVSSITVGGEPAPRIARSGALGFVTLLEMSSWKIRARVRARTGSALVLRDAFDEGWHADISGARHVEVDGYANAWVLPHSLDRVVTIEYDFAASYFIALAISIALTAIGLLAFVVNLRYR